jgi:hypothetical protein
MSVRAGVRAARRAAWARLGWRHPYVFILGPLVAAAVVVCGGYAGLLWVWNRVPHPVVAAVTAAASVGVMTWLVARRGTSRRVVVWSLAAVALLAGAAMYAAGR